MSCCSYECGGRKCPRFFITISVLCIKCFNSFWYCYWLSTAQNVKMDYSKRNCQKRLYLLSLVLSKVSTVMIILVLSSAVMIILVLSSTVMIILVLSSTVMIINKTHITKECSMIPDGSSLFRIVWKMQKYFNKTFLMSKLTFLHRLLLPYFLFWIKIIVFKLLIISLHTLKWKHNKLVCYMYFLCLLNSST